MPDTKRGVDTISGFLLFGPIHSLRIYRNAYWGRLVGQVRGDKHQSVAVKDLRGLPEDAPAAPELFVL